MSRYSHEYYIAHKDANWHGRRAEIRKDLSIPYGQTVYKPKNNPFEFTPEELWAIYLKHSGLIKEVMGMLHDSMAVV